MMTCPVRPTNPENEIAGWVLDGRFFLVCCREFAEYMAEGAECAPPKAVTVAEAREITCGGFKCHGCGNVHAAAF